MFTLNLTQKHTAATKQVHLQTRKLAFANTRVKWEKNDPEVSTDIDEALVKYTSLSSALFNISSDQNDLFSTSVKYSSICSIYSV